MELKKSKYVISKETVAKVLEALDGHWFTEDGEHNNDDIIAADTALKKEVKFNHELS